MTDVPTPEGLPFVTLRFGNQLYAQSSPIWPRDEQGHLQYSAAFAVLPSVG